MLGQTQNVVANNNVRMTYRAPRGTYSSLGSEEMLTGDPTQTLKFTLFFRLAGHSQRSLEPSTLDQVE